MTESNSITLKKCAKCKLVKPRTEFNKNKSKYDGLGTECRACANAHSRKYHADDLEAHSLRGKANYLKKSDEYKDRARKWELENPERKRALRAAYRKANRGKIQIFSAIDWKKHNEKRLARKKQYRKEKPWINTEHVRARQTRKQRAMPIWADREAIKAIYRQSAFATRVTGVKYHVDHYFPLKSDVVCGLHNEFNLRILPATANLSKSNKMPQEN